MQSIEQFSKLLRGMVPYFDFWESPELAKTQINNKETFSGDFDGSYHERGIIQKLNRLLALVWCRAILEWNWEARNRFGGMAINWKCPKIKAPVLLVGEPNLFKTN